MKKTLLVFVLSSLLFSFNSMAQNWLTSGNALSANGTLGSTTNFSVVFKSNNSERGRLTNSGLWGFGTTAPNSKVHINSASGQIPVRVQVNGSTKLLVHSGGGVSVGTGTTPPANGLYVSGSAGIGTEHPENKLHVLKGSAGTVTGYVNAPLIVENSTNSFINILAPNAAATGLFFGGPASNISGGIVYNDASYNPNGLDFRTNGNIVRMVLNSAGNLGVGTLSPGAKLHVFNGSAGSVTGYVNAPLIVENSTHNYINILAPDASETGILFGKPENNISGGIIYNNPSTPNSLQFRTNGNITQMVLDKNGNLGVGTITPGSYKTKVSHTNFGFDIENSSTADDWEQVTFVTLQLYFNGAFRGSFNNTTGAYTGVSDERLKTNIKPMMTMLDKINQLKPSSYQFKNTADKQEYNGFIAQDVMKIFPAMVTHNVSKERNLDVYSLDYSGFGVIAIKGIQELEPIIEEQKEKIATLEDTYKLKIATLEERIVKLEAALASITANNNENMSNVITNGSLEQNKPNPFNKNTIIHYSIPQGSKGQINIYDQGGKLIKTLKTNESGLTELSGYELAAGTYTYTLMVNGKVALSKQMLIVK